MPSVGIYRLKYKNECQGHSLTLFPWQQAVWPGTLDPVTKDSLSRLYCSEYSVSDSAVGVTLLIL